MDEIKETEKPKYVATLVRGNHHALREISWELGRSVVIDETRMLHLEEHAIDNIGTSDGEILSKHRFEFELYDGSEPVGYRFATDLEVEKADAVAAALAKGRRNTAAKAAVDAEMAAYDRENPPVTRIRSRARQ